MADSWFYAKNKQQFGPVGTAQIKRMLQSHQLLGSDLVWADGMPEWVPAASVAEFNTEPTGQPPVPPAELPFAPVTASAIGYHQPSQVVKPAGLAVASMVLGIISIVMFCVWYLSIPCGILSICFAIAARNNIKKGIGGGEGMAKAGLVLGIVGVSIPLLFILVVVGVIAGHPR